MHYLYHIENQVNGEVYVGKSMESVDSHWSEHLSDVRSGCTKIPTNRAMKKLGKMFDISQNIVSRIVNNKIGWVTRGIKNPKKTRSYSGR